MKSRPQLRLPVLANRSLAALFLAPLLLCTAQAAVITVPNFSFESALGGNWVTTTSGAGSVVARTDANLSYPTSGGTLSAPAQGTYILAMFNNNTTQQTASITLTDTFQANTIYTLSAAIGRTNNGFDGGKIELFAGSTLIASNSLTTQSTWTFTDISAVSTLGTGTVGQPLRIVLTSLALGGVAYRTDFDNVRLDATAVPEPQSVALLAGAGIFLLLRRRSRR